MNLVLTFCWREWRAQRAVLIAYTLMGIAALCLVFLLMPDHWWHDGCGAFVLSWFAAVGAIGVAAFVAPALVRSEYGTKHDHFVRRLPGALLPSFGGKLLFLVLATAAMPLLCLLAGEGFLLAIDRTWEDLFLWEHNGAVTFTWPWPALIVAAAALLGPWVWAIGTWLPGGRMAVGGTILFVLLLGFGVAAVLRHSPNIHQGIAWQWWLWGVPVLGLTVAAVSWAKGRRGGGPLRSARCGVAVAACGLVPPSAWVGGCAWDYHHPDPQQLAALHTYGLSPDGRYAIVRGAARESYLSVPFRVDLDTGVALQLGGAANGVSAEVARPSLLGMYGEAARFWRWYDYSMWGDKVVQHRVLDFTTLQWTEVEFDPHTSKTVLPADLLAKVTADARLGTRLRAPDGVRVWFDRSELCFEGAAGVVERERWHGALPTTMRPCGHGFEMFGGRSGLFDLTARRFVANEKLEDEWLVRGTLLYRARATPAAWLRVDPGSADAKPAGLHLTQILGLFDDDHLLCRKEGRQFFLWRVADGATVELTAPGGLPNRAHVQATAPFHTTWSLLPRDPRGRIWLWMNDLVARSSSILWLDAASRQIALAPPPFRDVKTQLRLLRWLDAGSVLVQDEAAASIVRIDVDTGERTVLFPRR